jgi:Flp pilus assembly pilin Flp
MLVLQWTLSSVRVCKEEKDMKLLRNCLNNLLLRESGAEPVQYAIALAFIIVIVMGGLRLLGNAANNQNNATSNMLQNAATPSSS